ncbi:hypothetical protein D3C78_1220640 [compost metagenome]
MTPPALLAMLPAWLSINANPAAPALPPVPVTLMVPLLLKAPTTKLSTSVMPPEPLSWAATSKGALPVTSMVPVLPALPAMLAFCTNIPVELLVAP